MDEICRAALERCVSIYEEIKGGGELQEHKYGTFPECVQLTQFRTIYGKTKLSNKKEIIQYWKYEKGELKSVESIKDHAEFIRSGMFFDMANLDFEIREDKVKLINENHLWVS